MSGLELPREILREMWLGDIDWEYSLIESEIDGLEGYFKTLEDLIDQEERREVSGLEKEAASIPKHAQSDFWNEFYPYWWRDILATQLRFSFIIWTIAVLEHNLKSVCSHCATIAGKEWTEPKREIVKDARKFLSGLGFKQPRTELWDGLQDRIKIRNFLVHQGVVVPDAEGANDSAWAKRIRTTRLLVQEIDGIEIENYQLRISADFCKSIIGLMKEFFAELHTEQIVFGKQ